MFGIKKKAERKKDYACECFRAVVNTLHSNLNIRPTPSVSLRPAATAPKGARLTVLEENGSWCMVEYRGIKGYAFKDYVLPLDRLNRT